MSESHTKLSTTKAKIKFHLFSNVDNSEMNASLIRQ